MRDGERTKLAATETNESTKTRAAVGQLYGLLHKANARKAEKTM